MKNVINLVGMLMLSQVVGCAGKNITMYNTVAPDVAIKVHHSSWSNGLLKGLYENGVRYTVVLPERYNSDGIKLLVVIDGSVYGGDLNKCFGGGYKFNSYNVSIYDTKTSTLLASYDDSGYSEGCPPLSGKLYENTANLIKQVIKGGTYVK